MKFIFFTDLHLCQGTDSPKGAALCFESMLGHDPEFLINGGDLGITTEGTDSLISCTDQRAALRSAEDHN